MKKYLLDTGPLAAWLLGRQGAQKHLSTIMQQGEAVTSIVVYGEVLEYLLKRYAHRPQLQQDLRVFLQTDAKPLSITQRVMEQYARVRIILRNTQGPQGQRLGLIGDADTLIAATAMVHGLTLITADTDLLRVPGLATWHIPPGQLH